MDLEPEVEQRIDSILGRDDRYRVEAYHFTIAALNYTMARMGRQQHVSATELMQGIRHFGVEQYGPLVRTVFNHWGVESSGQFGDIVFNLIDAGVLRKRDQDTREEFNNAAFDLEGDLDD